MSHILRLNSVAGLLVWTGYVFNTCLQNATASTQYECFEAICRTCDRTRSKHVCSPETNKGDLFSKNVTAVCAQHSIKLEIWTPLWATAKGTNNSQA